MRNVTMVALVGLLTIGSVLSLSLTGCNGEESKIDQMNDTHVSETTIPAIDRAAPMETETATFALG